MEEWNSGILERWNDELELGKLYQRAFCELCASLRPLRLKG